jgi:GTP cyclohydrolase I
MNESDRDDAAEKARRALAWLNTDQGREAIERSDRRVEETKERLGKGRDIDPKQLDEPFTV